MGELLTRKEVAEMLKVGEQWLIRHSTQGPDYFKLPGGTIRYELKDVQSWLKQRKVA